MKDFDEVDCLEVNPFEGDFGCPDDIVLRDKIVTSRKDTTCCLCLGSVAKGEKSRNLVAVFDGQLRSYRWCSECCHAMAVSWEDEGDAWVARERLRGQRMEEME